MSTVEFTYDWYDEFLARLLADGARFRSYGEEIASGDVLLRHDVDLSPERALRMARIEADRGVRATYFLLVSSPMYNPLDRTTRKVIAELDAAGHDVGLHFSTHQYWAVSEPPTERQLRDRVVEEQAVLGALPVEPIDIVSFHLPPDWVLERTFEGIDSTYEPRFFGDIGYRADSDQRWRDEPPLPDGRPEKLQVLTHPGLWGEEDGSFEERVREATDETGERVERYARTRYLEPVVTDA